MSYLFNGTDQYLETGAHAASSGALPFNPSGSDTYPCWMSLHVKPTVTNLTGSNDIIGVWTNAAGNTTDKGMRISQTYATNPDGFSINVDGGANSSIYGSIATLDWIHLFAILVSETSRFIYVNGVAATENTTSAVLATPPIDVLLLGAGTGGPSSWWGGKIAHLLVGHSYTPSAGEIAALVTKTPKHADLAAIYAAAGAYYPFTADANNEKSGSYHFTIKGTAADPTLDTGDNPNLDSGASTATISSLSASSFVDGQTSITITGTNFGAVEGTVIVSPTDDSTDVNAVGQTVTSWGDTSIVFTSVRSTLSLATTLYLFVIPDTNDPNTNGESVQFVTLITLMGQAVF